MPYEILKESHGVHKRFFGFVTAQEFFESIVVNQSDPDYEMMRYSINDYLAIEGHSVGIEDVTKAAGFAIGAAYYNADIKIAAVTQNLQIIGLIKRFTDLTKYDFQLFGSVDEARHWCANTERKTTWGGLNRSSKF